MKINSTIKWYNDNARSFKFAVEKFVFKNDLDQLEQFSKLVKANGKILDVGSGSGRDTVLFFKRGFDVVGMDLSKNLIKLSKESNSKIKFIQGSMLKIPFPDKYFDGLWVHASMLHISKMSDVVKAMSEFNRVCKSNGTLHVFVRAKMGRLKKEYLQRSDSKGKRLFRYFSQQELKTLLFDSGFELLSMEQYPESKNNPNGRSEIDWIVVLAKKIINL